MEAATVTGPARNLLEFAVRARLPDGLRRPAEIEIVTFVREGNSNRNANPFITAARARNIGVSVIPEKRRFDSGAVSELKAALHRIGPEIVQTHGVKSHFLRSLLGGRRVPGRWLAFHHGYTAEDLKMLVYNQFDRWSLRRADRVVTVCAPFASLLCRAGVARERIDILPNSIEVRPPALPEQIETLRFEHGVSAEDRVILCVGRLSPEKGHLDLLEAVRTLILEGNGLHVRLVVVGDGPLRAELERNASRLGIADRLVFAGHRTDVWPYYGLADLFVLPSHSEGSPNVLLEAMSSGLPIVATNVGGVSEMIEHDRSGLLTSSRRPAELAAAAARLLSDSQLASRLGRRAAERVGESFQPDNYRRSLLGIYESVLAGGAE